ncbi:hypothetical protein [Salidesulfovibrio brasiliensis]|uniref:hypothetical protein n=1 Tax=Salidesulfovibrio brasiliensis TaxID=221711 RepID=UPI0006CF2A28|nr:hypothetical protein [Salidesulfovibrio brasiliensis]
MSGNNTDDKYRKLAYDPATGGRKREWIRYGDGVYEPVRKDENPRDKWSDPHRKMTWWLEEKPEPWRPSDDGAGMSLNHDYGEENKPGSALLKQQRPGRSLLTGGDLALSQKKQPLQAAEAKNRPAKPKQSAKSIVADQDEMREGGRKRYTFGSVMEQLFEGTGNALGELGDKLPGVAEKLVERTGEAIQELDREVPDAVGKAITEGVDATGKSFEELANAYKNNEQFRTALHVALAAGMAPKLAVSAALYGPEAIATILQHPEKLATGMETALDMLDPNPVPDTPIGAYWNIFEQSQ